MLNQAVETASVRQSLSLREPAALLGSVAEGKHSYATLKAIVNEAGLLEPQAKYYAVKLAYTLVMFVLGLALLFLLRDWARVLVAAPALAFASAQLAFLAHDLGHKQIFSSTRLNQWVGMLVANLLVGMSLCWWVDKHNAHHANPNVEDLDPDIDIPFMSFSEDQAASKKGVARIFAAYQAFLFFPALTLTPYSMQVSSVLFTFRKQYKWRSPDIALLWAHFALYYVGVPLLMGLWQGLLFILVHRGLLGLLLGAVFAPNHKGMMVLDKEDKSLDFLRKQVLTARSVRSTPIIDFLYGGLNHQAVHHLFPNMPRNKLRDAAEIARRFCAEQDIRYHETGVRQSFKEIVQSLHEISSTLRRRVPVSSE